MKKRTVRKTRRSQTGVEKPAVRIGKKGATASVMKEIFKHLDKEETVKVKILRTALVDEGAENIAHKVAAATGAKIVQIRGHTFTLYLPKTAKKVFIRRSAE